MLGLPESSVFTGKTWSGGRAWSIYKLKRDTLCTGYVGRGSIVRALHNGAGDTFRQLQFGNERQVKYEVSRRMEFWNSVHRCRKCTSRARARASVRCLRGSLNNKLVQGPGSPLNNIRARRPEARPNIGNNGIRGSLIAATGNVHDSNDAWLADHCSLKQKTACVNVPSYRFLFATYW